MSRKMSRESDEMELLDAQISMGIEELVESRDLTASLGLFRRIKDDFYAEPFTLEDIREAYNSLDIEELGLYYGERDLRALEEMGLIERNQDGSYEINHTSGQLARLEWKEWEAYLQSGWKGLQ